MKNIRKVSNLSIAGILAVGVLLLGFFAYREKIQADTVLPGYATAHIGLNVTVPDARSVPFAVKFTPTNGGPTYYFKNRSFTFDIPGLNTVEWYIRKIPQGEYRVTLFSEDTELLGSPVDALLITDQVNDIAEFDLNLGEPYNPMENNYNQTIEPSPTAEESMVYESPVSTQTSTIVTPGEVQAL